VDEITQLIAVIQWSCRIVIFNPDAKSLIQVYHKYTHDGLRTPFNQLRENMHLVTVNVYNQGNLGQVQWMDSEGESLLIDGKRLSRADIRIGIETGIRALQEQLHDKVLLGSNVTNVTEDDLSDDRRDRSAGASFVS
jgi:hypothetical protein